MKKLLYGFLLVAAGLMGWAAKPDPYFEISKNLEILASLYREVNMYYVDEVNPDDFMRKGIDAMLGSLDPYTDYISESEMEDYRFMTTGQYGGIGAIISQKDDHIMVVEPYEGFPAQKAGLKAGDIILEVDGKSTKGKNTQDVSQMLKGSPSTEVKVLVSRPYTDKPFELTLTRETVSIDNVPYHGFIEPGIAYIKLGSFTENAGREVRNALNQLRKEGKLNGIVLDLRDNPGGLLHEAVNVSNVFVDKNKLVVDTRGKIKEWDKSYKTLNNPEDEHTPLVVLVNSRSASASEIVSGVIQDYDRGVILGQRTFGKGLVQTTRPLSYNSQLKITTSKYYIPSGRCIQAVDYAHRNEDGSVGKIPDSLMKPFKTNAGRTVLDGGGILPDIVEGSREWSNIAMSLSSKRHIFDFATYYAARNPAPAQVRDFVITDAIYLEFTNWLQGKDYDYTTRSEKALEDFRKQSEKEKYFTGIQEAYQELEQAMKHNKEEDLRTFREEISELLRQEIVARYFYKKGQIQASFDTDPEIRSAMNLLKDKPRYREILAP